MTVAYFKTYYIQAGPDRICQNTQIDALPPPKVAQFFGVATYAGRDVAGSAKLASVPGTAQV